MCLRRGAVQIHVDLTLPYPVYSLLCIAHVMSVVTANASSSRDAAGSHPAALGNGTRVSWWRWSTRTTNDALNTRVMQVSLPVRTTHVELINTFIV